jgi:hypothetical protein
VVGRQIWTLQQDGNVGINTFNNSIKEIFCSSRIFSKINTILSVLEDLDSYVFEKMDTSSNWMDTLYGRLFDPIPSGSQHDPAVSFGQRENS